ncbi:response regulator [Paenibacillus rigui]|uniref:DNA-binding response regulator n=1 Tax=Paenibacillus rigui TaxID=554312 RepID=A0A229UJB1_9BACL|nr:response regulator [Paenibacillus rigui]OXM83470.1 DNA-binding response regulator [Paenibacillus rigui]
MIKVLVVDDDKLVRKGLISAMPWSDFGMEVVGEANNGEKALDFLQSNAVDLLLTDLAMPVMSGIELMRVVRKSYPHIHMVVLTLHQDFEYVQEALRLGAIDYIAKVQLEKERFEEVLERIIHRIQQDHRQQGSGVQTHADGIEPGDAVQEQGGYTADRGYAFVTLDSELDGSWLGKWSDASGPIVEVDLNLWLWVASNEGVSEFPLEAFKRQQAAQLEGWALVELEGLSGMQPKDVHRALREYREKELFYEYAPRHELIRLSLNRDAEPKPAASEEGLADWKAQWLSYDWIHQEEQFVSLLEKLKRLRLPQAKLFGLVYSLFDDWNRVFHHVSEMRLPASFHYWFQTAAWYESVRDMIRGQMDKTSYSQEVIHSIMKALTMIHEALDQQLTAADLAKRVSMSRSYFSQCFKDIAGKTFNDYLRQARVDKAKQYLLHTNKTIIWIAENTGYSDEKYFSRTFRELTGMLPSEFRTANREGRPLSSK